MFVPEEIVLAANATLVDSVQVRISPWTRWKNFFPGIHAHSSNHHFGFKLGKVCPYLESADMVVGENTCDGKKKGYETLSGMVDNLYVMDLPQVKSEQGKLLLKKDMNVSGTVSRN